MSKTVSQHTSFQVRLLGGRQLSLNWTTVALAILVTMAAALRLYKIDASGLWVDEIFTALFASPDKTFAEVAQGPLNSPLPTPPLWFWITHVFVLLFGTGDVVVRLPSVIAGALGVWAICKVGETLFDRSIGLVSALLLTVSPAHLYHSREARFYAAIVLFSLLTLYFLHRGINTGEKRWWAGFIIVTLLNICIHLAAFFVLAAEVAYVGVLLVFELIIARKGDLRSLFRETWALPCLISLGVIAICYLPMVPYLLTGIQGPRGLGNVGKIYGLNLSVRYFLRLFGLFGAGPGIPLSLYVGTALWGVGNAVRTHRRQVLLFLLAIGMPFVIILLMQPKHWFNYKYVIFILPVYLVTIALGLTYLARSISQVLEAWPLLRESNLLQSLILGALALTYGLFSISVLNEAYFQRSDRWRSVAQLLTSNVRPEDAVAVLPVELLTMPAEEIMGYYGPTSEESNVAAVDNVGQVQALLAAHRRVWVVMDRRVDYRVAGDVVAWLRSRPHVQLSFEGGASVFYIGENQTQLALLEEVQRFTITTPEIHDSVAKAYRALGMWEESAAAYERAIAMEPEQGVWHYRLALLYDNWGQPDAALAEYQQAIRVQPEIPSFQAALGAFYARNGFAESAISAYNKAVSLYLSQNRGTGNSYYVLLWRDEIRALETSIEGNEGR